MSQLLQLKNSLEAATSNPNLEYDWNSIMEICDMIGKSGVSPISAINEIKEKIFSLSAQTALNALIVLEAVADNCGSLVQREIASKDNCEIYVLLIQTTNHENVRSKMLEMIQTWNKNFQNREIEDTMNILKMEGYKLTEVGDVQSCRRCTVVLSFDQYKYHCRFCDKVCCVDCTTLLENARVCFDCFEGEKDLPVENQELPPEATNEFEDDWEDEDENELQHKCPEHQAFEATAPVEDEGPNIGETCRVCCVNPIDSALVQCGHMCMCYDCSLIVRGPNQNNSGPCPICLEPIEKVLRIFKS